MHEAVWNPRLQTTGGRFFPKDGHLDFNPKLYEQVDELTFRKIVRHELCHYHLYFAQKGYRHRDRDFRELLAQVDGLRYAPSIGKQPYQYRCQSCRQAYSRKRRLNVNKYRCGKCRGILRMEEGKISP